MSFLEQDKNPQYRRELPLQCIKQVALYQELRDQGVMSAVEEEVGKKIASPIVIRYRRDGHYTDITWKTFFSKERARQIDADHNWGLDFKRPILGEDGSWNSDLHLHGEQKLWTGSLPRLEQIGLQWFDLLYTTDRVLAVKGQSVAFKGALPAEEEVRVALIREALRSVIKEPAERVWEARNRIISGHRYRDVRVKSVA